MRWLLLLVGSISHDRHYHIIQSRDEGGLQLCVCLYVNSGAPPHHHRFPFCFSFFFFFYSVMSTILTQYPATAWELKAMEWVWKKGEYILYTMQQVLISLNANTAARKSDMEANVRHARPQHTAVCIRSVYMLALYIELARMWLIVFTRERAFRLISIFISFYFLNINENVIAQAFAIDNTIVLLLYSRYTSAEMLCYKIQLKNDWRWTNERGLI